jgi:hypothetical protein
MIISNPDDSRNIYKMREELMRKQNLHDAMNQPAQHGCLLDPLIPDRTPPKRPQ